MLTKDHQKKLLPAGSFFRKNLFPLFLLLLSLLAFGILIPWLGFYMDDWSLLYLAYDKNDLTTFFQHKRPWLAPLYASFSAILPPKPLPWHLLLLLLKWLGAVVVWHLMRKVLPQKPNLAQAVSALYLLYPGHLIAFHPLGFLFHYIQALFIFASFLVHLEFIHREERSGLLLLIAICLSLANLIISEYFFFIELLRPILLFFFIHNAFENLPLSEKIKKTLYQWLPFLLVFSGVVLFRFHIQADISRYNTQPLFEYLSKPVQTFTAFINEFFHDFPIITLQTWKYAFHPKDVIMLADYQGMILYICIMAVTFLLSTLYQYKYQKEYKNDGRLIYGVLLILGAISVFLSCLPFWLADVKFQIGFNVQNRYIIPSALGASLILAGLLFLLPLKKLIRIFITSVFISFMVGAHFLYANSYRHEWEQMKRMLWQITWRINSIQPDTLIISNELPLQMISENSLSAIFNWMYSTNTARGEIDYYCYFDEERFIREVGSLERPCIHTSAHMIGTISSSNTHLLGLSFSPDTCVRVLDAGIDLYNPALPGFLKEVVYYSTFDTQQLLKEYEKNGGVISNIAILGPQPAHEWCFYYQKAMQAYQQEHWIDTINEYNQAITLGYFPRDVIEWIPFVKAYALSGQVNEAIRITTLIYNMSHQYGALMCNLWKDISKTIGATPDKPSPYIHLFFEMNCPVDFY
ncbi:MAG TPA: hypothetical protein G4N92_07970 [Anaerolineae bacterium]|nr:hypothetical protein [Anaerolineae bacterium]